MIKTIFSIHILQVIAVGSILEYIPSSLETSRIISVNLLLQRKFIRYFDRLKHLFKAEQVSILYRTCAVQKLDYGYTRFTADQTLDILIKQQKSDLLLTN